MFVRLTRVGMLESGDDAGALVSFDAVISMEREKGEWGFKALKQIVKILFKTGKTETMLARYKELLSYVNEAVTKNESEKTLNTILDIIGANNDMVFLQEFYETTLKKLEETKN